MPGGPAGWGPAGRRGALCVHLRSARLPGSGDHMSSGAGYPPQPARGRPEAAALQPGSPGPPRSANHVYLLLFLFQGLWQFQEEIR